MKAILTRNNVYRNDSYSIFEISVARGLWNNLIQPVGQKSFDYNITVPFLCPSKERPYLATSKNGKSNTSSELLSNKKDFISLMGTTLAQSTLCPIWFQQKITCHPIINQGCVYVLIKVSNLKSVFHKWKYRKNMQADHNLNGL